MKWTTWDSAKRVIGVSTPEAPLPRKQVLERAGLAPQHHKATGMVEVLRRGDDVQIVQEALADDLWEKLKNKPWKKKPKKPKDP